MCSYSLARRAVSRLLPSTEEWYRDGSILAAEQQERPFAAPRDVLPPGVTYAPDGPTQRAIGHSVGLLCIMRPFVSPVGLLLPLQPPTRQWIRAMQFPLSYLHEDP